MTPLRKVHTSAKMGLSCCRMLRRRGKGLDGKPCKYSGDEFSRRCNCRKHFRWTQNGTQYRRKAGTRSWEEAEEIKRQFQDQLAGRTHEQGPEDTRSHKQR